jgi:catechol 2,3-dioxygenase-like lactoylglutathione lyase family enzyme
MSLHLDHAVIAVNDLEQAIHDYRSLGFTVMPGGTHANRATHNALIPFANGTYLELLAATGEPPVAGMIDFSVLLCNSEGLAGFALRADDLDAEITRLRAEGLAVGPIIPGQRRRQDGTLVGWKLALLDGGFAPFLIQDVTPRDRRISPDPAVTTHANTATGLLRVEMAARDLLQAQTRYARLLGLSALTDSPVSGAVTLRSGEADGLFALHLTFDRSEGQDFPLDRAHQVRLLARAASGN